LGIELIDLPDQLVDALGDVLPQLICGAKLLLQRSNPGVALIQLLTQFGVRLVETDLPLREFRDDTLKPRQVEVAGDVSGRCLQRCAPQNLSTEEYRLEEEPVKKLAQVMGGEALNESVASL